MSLSEVFSRSHPADTDGAAEVKAHTSGSTLSSGDWGKFHYVDSASNLSFALSDITASIVGKSIWFYKANTGSLDINAHAGNNIEGEPDVENTTTETYALICMKATAVGEASFITLIGSWQ